MTLDQPLSVIASGAEDDVPRQELVSGKVCIVGGTVIIRGIRRGIERQAIHRVLQVLVSLGTCDIIKILTASYTAYSL
jgi:1-phosphatidylinositol-3-phosphate 5-kinase